MYNIQSLIKMLQSDNPNKRYDACEELRVSPQPLPQEALDALNSITNDSNTDVADAAQRALALHAQISNEPEQRQEQDKGPLSRFRQTLTKGISKRQESKIGFILPALFGLR